MMEDRLVVVVVVVVVVLDVESGVVMVTECEGRLAERAAR